MSTTLEVIDSYLSLDSTQYAQAPIGATRLATKGNGTNLYGTIPTWTASNLDIEFDIVFPTTLQTGFKFFFDSTTANAVGYRITFYTANPTGAMSWVVDGSASMVVTMDGTVISNGAITHPIDGAVHHFKITENSVEIRLSTLYQFKDAGSYFANGSLFNLLLNDRSNPANSRFYPMDETIATATFLDTSANAQHGTWFNRVSGDVITVYPGAIKPSEGFWIACKFRLPVTTASKFIMNVGSYVAGGSSVVLRTDSASKLIASRYNATTAITNATSTITMVAGTEYIVLIKQGADNSIRLYVNAIANTWFTSSANVFATVLDWVNLNGAKSSSGAAAVKGDVDIYYAYLYNGTPSNDDINALMAGENPMYVGDIRQGYNLVGNGDEVNGGPALTLYGAFDGEQWYVPYAGRRPLMSRLVMRSDAKRLLASSKLKVGIGSRRIKL